MVQVLEAIIVGVLIVSAVFFALAFQAPPPPSAVHGAKELEQVTWDSVRALDAMYYDDASYGNSTLSKVVADALGGDSSALVETMANIFPPGTAYNIYLSNGYGRFPVHVSREPTGQTVGISYPFEPKWRYVFASPDLHTYDSAGLSTTMGVTAIPLFDGNLIDPEGPLVEIEVRGNQSWIPGNAPAGSGTVPFEERAYTGIVQGGVLAGSDYPSVSIYMECDADPDPAPAAVTPTPCYAMDHTSSPVLGYEPHYPDHMMFVIENAGPGDLPPESELAIRFPVGLYVDDVIDTDFTNTQIIGTGPSPQVVVAETPIILTPGSRMRLNVSISIEDDRYAFKHVGAEMSGKAVSVSQFLVKVANKADGTYTGGDARAVLVSSPRPHGSAAGPGSPTPAGRWGIVLPMAFGDGAVDALNISLPDGEGILADMQWPADFSPQYPSPNGVKAGSILPPQDNYLRWDALSGDLPVDAYTFVEWQFELRTSGVFTEASPKLAQAAPHSRFEGYSSPPMHIQAQPGMFWREEPPAATGPPPSSTALPGFGTSFIIGSQVNTTFDALLLHRNQLLVGDGTYRVADLTDVRDFQAGVKDAARAGSLTPSSKRVAIGENVQFLLDSADLLSFLSASAGVTDVDLRTELYAPWGVRQRIPAATWEHTSASGIISHPLDIEVAWLDGDSSQDVLVASTDGNVYGVAGASGRAIAGRSFVLPGAGDPLDPSGATHLTRSNGPGVGQIYGVGTNTAAASVHSLDASIDERWAGDKHEADVATLGINTSMDLTGDLVPDLFVASDVNTAPGANAAGHSRWTLYDGADGSMLPGWTSNFPSDLGFVVNGTSSELAMGKVGAGAEEGVYGNTGLVAGVVAAVDIQGTVDALFDEEVDDAVIGALNDAIDFSIGIYDSGMVAADVDGNYAWNYTGGRFTRIENAPRVDTEGDWTGFVAGGGDGWAYGFSAKKAITPVTGIEFGGLTRINDIAMSNALEGYIASTDGYLAYTRDGWTTMIPHFKEITVGSETRYLQKSFPNTEAVDTPDGDYLDGTADVSWWAGRSGLLLRSTDRLATMDTLTTTGKLHSGVTVTPGGTTLDPGDLGDFALTNVDLFDVYAVDANEAWFVGSGRAGTGAQDKAYVVHTTDGGTTLLVTEIDCRDGLLQIIADCSLRAITHDGEHLWVVGNPGLVLVQTTGGMAGRTHYDEDTTPGINANDALRFDLELDPDILVDATTMRVSWDNSEIEWMRSIVLNGNTIWNVSDGAAYSNPAPSPGVGAPNAAIIDLQGYDDRPLGGNPDNNEWTGPAKLALGPFKKTGWPLVGYYDASNFPTPTEFRINVTFSDGTRDEYVVTVDATPTGMELSPASWVEPTAIGYTTPECFGLADEECTTFQGVDVRQLGPGPTAIGGVVGDPQIADTDQKFQASFYWLNTTTKTWAPKAIPASQRMLDVAINDMDPTRWIMVGANDRVLASYDTGDTWTVVPKIYDVAQGPAAPLFAVDYTHPDVGYIVGGSATGLLWTMDGYTEWGRVETIDLYSDAQPLRVLGVDHSLLTLSQEANGLATVRVEVLDATGTWITVHDPDTGWLPNDPADPTMPEDAFTISLNGDTEVIKLRITLANPVHGFSRFSPQLLGQLQFKGWTPENAGSDWDKNAQWEPPDAGATLSVGDATKYGAGSPTVEMADTAAASNMRLKAVHNPWIHRLGNPASDWGSVNQTQMGARVADLDLSVDGWTTYVGTEGIYPIGDTDAATAVYDNTLYAINTTTGKLQPNWNLVTFTPDFADDGPDPIVFVRAGPNSVYVLTHDPLDASTPGPYLWQVDFDGTIMGDPYQFLGTEEVLDIELGQVFNVVQTDPVVALRDTVSGDGWLVAIDGQFMTGLWKAQPALKGLFAFDWDVPKNSLYGAHILETQITWDATANYLGAGKLLQTARIYSAFTVTPPNGRVPISPTYSMEVVTWLEDWG